MKINFQLNSTDSISQLNGFLWTPDNSQEGRCVIQLVHGMAEYIDRYHDFATYLNQEGFIVIGHDHLGHGNSLSSASQPLGYFTPKNSPEVLIEDVHLVTEYGQSLYPDLPYFILGHSMGSFILRNYLKKHSEGLSGAIIMGTGGHRSEINLILPIVNLLNRTAPKKVNKLIDRLAFGSFSRSFPEKHSSMDWLSKNPLNVRNYLADPLLGSIFTNNGFYTLFNLMDQATKKNWFASIKKNLPLLIISGEADPVGNFGKGPKKVALELAEGEFKHVTLQLYPELRHEILNELEKELVYLDITTWLKKYS